MKYLIGVDIGGTTVKLGLIQHGEAGEEFKVIRQSSIATQPEDPAATFAQRVAAAVKELLDAGSAVSVDGIGVGCPGLIDPWKGQVRTSPNLKNLPNFALKKHLAEYTGLPVEIQNDANAAVLGEWLFSPDSKGISNMVLFTLGTGVGGGVICDSHLLLGAQNAATELGHIKVEYAADATECACGKRGCIEAYAGIRGIRTIASKLIAAGTRTTLAQSDTLSTKDLARAATAGDEVACRTFHTVGRYLGRTFAIMFETFAPEKIVVGGGASAALDLMLPGINASLDECSSFAFTRGQCKIERSRFPSDINVIGAAAVYLNSHR